MTEVVRRAAIEPSEKQASPAGPGWMAARGIWSGRAYALPDHLREHTELCSCTEARADRSASGASNAVSRNSMESGPHRTM